MYIAKSEYNKVTLFVGLQYIYSEEREIATEREPSFVKVRSSWTKY
jgi:hypothetical protein